VFEKFRNSFSRLLPSRWPTATGEVTAVHFLDHQEELVVEYKFLVKDDGPFVGEDRVSPLMNIQTALAVGAAVTVRYRPDDPSDNVLDVESWQGL
jgi:hypothetical protein